MRPLVWLVLLLFTLPAVALAQETRRQISGTLRDADAVVPGTTVRIKNLETKVTQNLVTNVASPQRGPEKSGRSRSPRSGLSSRFMNSPG